MLCEGARTDEGLCKLCIGGTYGRGTDNDRVKEVKEQENENYHSSCHEIFTITINTHSGHVHVSMSITQHIIHLHVFGA